MEANIFYILWHFGTSLRSCSLGGPWPPLATTPLAFGDMNESSGEVSDEDYDSASDDHMLD